jgi:hypothetical protein
VARGNKGVALINFTNKNQSANLETTLADGKYVDKVHNQIFEVSDGHIVGKLQPLTSYVIY